MVRVNTEYAFKVIWKRAKIVWVARYFICELKNETRDWHEWDTLVIDIFGYAYVKKIQTQSEAKSESELQAEAVAQAQLQQHAQLNIANSDAWTFQSAQIHIEKTHAFFSAFVFERIERHGITLDTKINETASDFARISAQYFIWISIRSCLIIYSYFKMQQMKSERKKENKINASEY